MYHLDVGWYTSPVPTTRPRHQLTETPDIARAIDLAAKQWPGEPRSRLLRRLVVVGGGTLADDEHEATESRREAVIASSGKYVGAFGPDYLTDLRQDFPA